MSNRFLQFLGLIKRSGSLVEGYNKCEEVIKNKRLYLILLSSDCSESTKRKFIQYCSKYNILYIESFKKEDLGMSIGRREISILGITDKNMSTKLITLWNDQNKI